jgi:peptide-methionine (R)-S-oxide reductase
MIKSEEENFKEKLTPEQYHILVERGTEKPFTGKLLYNKNEGSYVCGACGNVIFDSLTKFDSGCGWPSFYDAKPNSVKLKKDFRNLMFRTEVLCGRCGSHLGHVFKDAPRTPTGLRYCINSLALDFREKKNGKEKRDEKRIKKTERKKADNKKVKSRKR